MFKFRPLFLLFLLSAASTALCAQDKRPLDHSVYDTWESLGNVSIPYNGKYLHYSVLHQDDDAVLYLLDLQTSEKKIFPRGKNPEISIDGQDMLYRISPTHEEIHQAKVKKKKGADMPKDTLVILNLKSGSDKKIPFLKKLDYGKHLSRYVAFNVEEPEKKDSLSSLFVMDISTFTIDTINMVEKFIISDDGKYLSYITKPGKKDSVTVRGLYLRDLAAKRTRTLLTGAREMKIELPVFEEKGSRLAFYAQQDTSKALQKFTDIYLYDTASAETSEPASVLVNTETEGLREGWMVGIKGELRFFRDALLFGTKPVPEDEDTTIAEFERVKLDIWKWDGDYLPPMKEAMKERFENITYLAAVYFNEKGKMVQIEDEQMPDVILPDKLKGDMVLGLSDKPYRIQQQWNTDPLLDIYRVNVRTGEREMIFQGSGYNKILESPFGTYYTLYDAYKKNWFLYETATGYLKDLTSSLGVPFWKEDGDVPELPEAYTDAYWNEEEKYFIIGDKYDLWQFDPIGAAAPFTVTEGQGRSTETTFRIIRPVYDPEYSRKDNIRGSVPLKTKEPLYFSSFNRKTRYGGFYYKDVTKKKSKLMCLKEAPKSFRFFQVSLSYEYPGIASVSKSNKPPRKLSIPVFIYSEEDFQNSTDLYVTRDYYRTSEKITETNPQQKNYLWGTVEMVSWTTADSIPAEGMLFKPENFDSSKKYPMIIYFYEKNANTVYQYRSPAPSRSIVNIPYFVSNGYLVFVPDIYYGKPGSGQYLDGHPGQCAMNSIMPGVDMLCRNSWVDSEHMAIQGQSWGGYQVAYMITQTDRFAAAGAGAPVSNMTSAYGGIRWGSGHTRQFQYEKGQSRIGDDLWKGFNKYYENSPLFFVPDVKTPVLIMHNDKDTAVPWYQGIEFFTALRRLSKPAWMLQYKGEDHNLRQRHNCKDLSVKLAEFFDYYLKGAPEPEWMNN